MSTKTALHHLICINTAQAVPLLPHQHNQDRQVPGNMQKQPKKTKKTQTRAEENYIRAAFARMLALHLQENRAQCLTQSTDIPVCLILTLSGIFSVGNFILEKG